MNINPSDEDVASSVTSFNTSEILYNLAKVRYLFPEDVKLGNLKCMNIF